MFLTREQLQERLIALHRASLELIRDVSLEHLLERIAQTACEQAGARYAALGVLDEDGRLKQFITVGMTSEEIKRMAHPPVGKGLIGALMDTEQPIRLPVISNDPRAAGFPKNHPPMTSFLGVPIRAGDVQLGQIYLTDKIDSPEFTADDERIITICDRLNHYNTLQCVTAERAFLAAMGGGCQSPVGACAEVVSDQLHMRAVSFAGESVRRAEARRPIKEAVELGQQIAAGMKDRLG